ncbi:MAG: DUF1918 domain-containing protein [Gaiellaceae bacterium]
MVQTENGFRAHIGDLVVVEGRRLGQTQRVGEILKVLGAPGHEHYSVRWEDGRETVFYPSNDAIIQHAERKKKRK